MQSESIVSKPMTQETPRFRNIHLIVATSAGLVLLVSLALAWLGWRLLTQEESLQNQQARNGMEQGAELLLAGFLRKVAENEALLSRLGPALPPDVIGASQAGAVVVSFSKAGVEAQPPGQLLYYPSIPPAEPFDAAVFATADKLEFQPADLKAAAITLASIAESKDSWLRSEAVFRLARVQRKNGQTAEALATYAKLAEDQHISSLEVPYGLLSRIRRSELLAEWSQAAVAREEAAIVIAGLESGKWRISKESYKWYDGLARKLAGKPAESHAPEIKLAIAAAVDAAWDEWQLFQTSPARSLTKHLHRADSVPVLTIVNANPERMVSLIYAGDALRHLGLDAASTAKGSDMHVWLTDQRDKPIFGEAIESSPIRVRRNLSAAEIPWQLNVAASSSEALTGFPSERRTYLISALAAIVLLVGLACYAMARGVLREAAAGRLQSDFVSAVSHEFRSPLTTLRQLTELLAEGRINDEGRRRRYFSVLQQETSRLHQLVEDLLDFGRMDAGRRQYRMEPLDVSELVHDAVDDYQRQAGASKHKIEIAADYSDLVVNADREAIRRVVRNLLENAVKYSPDATTVWVEMGCENRTAILRVRDEGIGIPQEEQSRIFEKFVRGDAAKQACIPGTGIGLAMVKEIVRVHHGEVGLSSEVGRGTTFMVRLPLSNATAMGSS